MRTKLLIVALASAVSLPVFAQDSQSRTAERSDRDIYVRDTRSVYTVTNRTRPLTSVYLDTTSTRLVDARRGFRPYDTIHNESRRDSRHLSSRVYRDVYGASRRAPHGYYDPNPPAPRTSVTSYGGDRDRDRDADRSQERPPIVVIIRDERGANQSGDPEQPRGEAEPQAQPEPVVMEVTIYEGEPEMPEHSGAVIVRKDGTVISVGD